MRYHILEITSSRSSCALSLRLRRILVRAYDDQCIGNQTDIPHFLTSFDLVFSFYIPSGHSWSSLDMLGVLGQTN